MRRLRAKTRVDDGVAVAIDPRPSEACPAQRPRQQRCGAQSRKPRTKKIVREAASHVGLLPKARRAFALFRQARWSDASLPHASADKIRLLGQEWAGLPEEDKQLWREKSKSEFDAQRRAAMLSGIRVRCYKGKGPTKTTLNQEACPPNRTAESPRMLLGNYDCGAARGEGSYGLVLLARHVETGRCDALKVFKQGSDKAELHHELQMCRDIESCERAKASRFFLSPVDCSVESPMSWIAFPYAGLSLRECLRRGSLDDVAATAVIAQLVMSVGHLHRMYVCHLVFKASNVSGHWMTLRSSSLTWAWPSGSRWRILVSKSMLQNYTAHLRFGWQPVSTCCLLP